MKLSLIIPVYKVEEFIKQCLNSIFSQITNYNTIEVIVINDGTPDNSMQIVREYSIYPQLRIIEQENKGLSIARNTGLFHAKGEYIWFIDSDDWLLPNAIKDVLYYIENNYGIPVFSTILELHIESTNKILQEYYPKKKELTGKEYLLNKYKQGASQRFIFKKSFLTENNLEFYPKILHEDGLFGYKMLYLANKIQILDKPVYAYRIRETGSIMSSISMRTPQDMLFIHKELINFCNNKVDIKDKIWYRLCIFSIIINLFQFSKGLAFNKDFAEFYKRNKTYIQKEASFVLKNKTLLTQETIHNTYIIKLMPLMFLKIKLIVKRILKR